MIVESPTQLTEAVLDQTKGTSDPRLREILQALIRHLHGFVREVNLTEEEFDFAIRYVASLGHHTTGSRNETRLICGSLGLSTLVCLINNGGPNAARESSANLLGPNWRKDAPRVENGGTIIRSPTPGEPILFTGWVRDTKGAPIAGADVDVWQPSPNGLYENQDPSQAEFNLRGRFTTDAKGMFAYRSIKPGYYPIPVDGPVGDLLRAQNRQPYRPAHLHSLIYKPGFKTIASQIYNPDDPYLQIDAQFGVTPALMGKYVLHKEGTPPAPDMKAPWYTIEHVFVLEFGKSWLPSPPVSAKAKTTEGVTL